MHVLSQTDYSKCKAALTRAINSGSAERIIATVRAARHLFERQGWPDDWPRWRRAVDDLWHHDDEEIAWMARHESAAWGL